MAGQSNTTTDHETIRRWAEERGGEPATVRGTEDGDEQVGDLGVVTRLAHEGR